MRRVMLGLLGLMACGEVGSGTLEVVIYGEEFIEEAIPADVFADGWTVEFEQFLVVVGEVSVGEGSTVGAGQGQFTVYDLARGSGGAGHAVMREEVAAGLYDSTAYVIGPAGDAVGVDETVDVAAVSGKSVYVKGKATKGGVTKTFAWGFATRTEYSGCMSSADVKDMSEAGVQLTIHGDHLFYDDLFAEEPAVRFDLVAQADDDGDGNGEVSQAELEAVDIRPQANYQVGSTGIVDLWHFIEHQTTTLGHIDGEGHCEATRVE